MTKRWFFIVPAAILGILLFGFLGGELVLQLWNWLLPPLFGWRADHLLAGSWPSGAVPDSLRRIWTPRFRPSQFRPSHGDEDERALWKHDPRGAGELPAGNARTLGLRPNHQREQGVMKSG